MQVRACVRMYAHRQTGRHACRQTGMQACRQAQDKQACRRQSRRRTKTGRQDDTARKDDQRVSPQPASTHKGGNQQQKHAVRSRRVVGLAGCTHIHDRRTHAHAYIAPHAQAPTTRMRTPSLVRPQRRTHSRHATHTHTLMTAQHTDTRPSLTRPRRAKPRPLALPQQSQDLVGVPHPAVSKSPKKRKTYAASSTAAMSERSSASVKI